MAVQPFLSIQEDAKSGNNYIAIHSGVFCTKRQFHKTFSCHATHNIWYSLVSRRELHRLVRELRGEVGEVSLGLQQGAVGRRDLLLTEL